MIGHTKWNNNNERNVKKSGARKREYKDKLNL